ncbi:LysM domain-containing protein [Colletotrichum kahawae]|uniref:LysM domain-containing protein n=1 Tax=Colletotrichum kahawae TaxID=34407 RepID=A0AAD9YFG6_COLKA|nr:LysM domain-containing protein [Colletotrichum kahawae]
MHITRLLAAAGLLPGIVFAKTGTQSRRAVDCAFSIPPGNGDTCASFADSWGVSVDDLKKINPGITCPGLDTSKSYCVIGTVNDDPESTTTATSTRRTTLKTSTSKPSTTPKTSSNKPSTTSKKSSTAPPAPSNSPAMPGLAANCNAFYKVSSGDQCGTIAAKHGISTAQFRSWNREVNADCTNLWLGYYVCVRVPGATTTSRGVSQPTTTKPPSSGPSPQMPGIIAGCKSYHQVKSGDSCWTIYTKAGITLNQFLSWNKGVDSKCSNLWLGYYVCTRV